MQCVVHTKVKDKINFLLLNNGLIVKVTLKGYRFTVIFFSVNVDSVKGLTPNIFSKSLNNGICLKNCPLPHWLQCKTKETYKKKHIGTWRP